MTAAPADWPALMPGTDDDPRGPRAQAATLLDAASRDTEGVRPQLDSGDLPESVRRLARDADAAINEVRQHVHRAAGRLDQLAVDDIMNPAGRERLTRETKATTAAALRELDSRSATSLDLLEAGLTATTQPSFPPGADRGEAREELRMLLDAAPDPADKVRELVAGSDPRLAALAASPYAATYLRSRGVPDDVIRATAVHAAQAALTSGDPTRQAAALALTKLDTLRKARIKALNAANFAIGWDS